ncbi:MAG: TonB family protein [Balneolaceae bacterium]|nr:TonB family protein [Balneolaceae bacterium]
MGTTRKKPKADLRKYYTVFWEIGLVVVLLIFIIAMKVDLRGGENNIDLTEEQEVVKMKEVVQTQQKKKPPPPPQPQVPVEVPNDKVIDEVDINLDSELDLDEPLPEPPQQKSEGDKEEDFFVAVEDQPELIGGIGELQKKVTYPPRCKRAGIEGRVTVQFIVNTQGEVENPKVIRGIGGGCDQAAIEAIKEHAKFKPGRQRGKAVNVQMSLPILFRLQ